MNEEKNGLNGVKDIALTLKDSQFSISYSRSSNLIKALFMVTDIMDKDESVRQKLRVLGTDILSDIYTYFFNPNAKKLSVINPNGHIDSLVNKVSQVLSFLDISSSVGLISEMNFSILNREFLKLLNAINEYDENRKSFSQESTLASLFKEEESEQKNYSIRHIQPTRIGVQKGSTLLKALSDKMTHHSSRTVKSFSDEKSTTQRTSFTTGKDVLKETIDFDLLKKQRRFEIIKVIKDSTDGASITDIMNKNDGSLKSVSEKTLQRELVAMVADGVLKKSGSKRWSRYFLAK